MYVRSVSHKNIGILKSIEVDCIPDSTISIWVEEHKFCSVYEKRVINDRFYLFYSLVHDFK